MRLPGRDGRGVRPDLVSQGLGVLRGHPHAGRRVDRPALRQGPGHQLHGGVRVDVLLLDVLPHLGRDARLGPGDQQAPLTRQVGEQVGDEVAEGMRVAQHPLTVAGDGGAQRLVGLSLRVELLAHVVPPRLPAGAALMWNGQRAGRVPTGVRLGPANS